MQPPQNVLSTNRLPTEGQPLQIQTDSKGNKPHVINAIFNWAAIEVHGIITPDN